MGLELKREVRARDIDLGVKPKKIFLEIISLYHYYIIFPHARREHVKEASD